jgi:hypothetical protein
MHSHGETYVTLGAGSLPYVGAMTTNAAKANDARFTALAYTTLLLSRESNFQTYEHRGDSFMSLNRPRHFVGRYIRARACKGSIAISSRNSSSFREKLRSKNGIAGSRTLKVEIYVKPDRSFGATVTRSELAHL